MPSFETLAHPGIMGGFVGNFILVVGSVSLMILLKFKEESSKSYKGALMLETETWLLLRICAAIPFCNILFGFLVWLADFGGGRENMLVAVIQLRSNTILQLLIFAILLIMSGMLILNAYSLIYNAKKKFEPIFIRENGEPNVMGCMVGVRNGFWGYPLFKSLGKGGSITCVDTWNGPRSHVAVANMLADGVPYDAITQVTTKSYVKLPLPSNTYDVVLLPTTLYLIDEEDREAALKECVRILEPNGQIFIICPFTSKKSTISLMEKSNLINITSTACWTCFIPYTLLKATKDNSKKSMLDAPIYKVIDDGVLRGGGEDTQDGADTTPLLVGNNVLLKPRFRGLRIGFQVILLLLIAAICCTVAYLWPALDVPKNKFSANQTLASGWLAPYCASLGVLWLQIGSILKEFSREPQMTSSNLTKKFLLNGILGVIISVLPLGWIWTPGMIANVIMAKYDVSNGVEGVVAFVISLGAVYSMVKFLGWVQKRELAKKKKQQQGAINA